MFRSTIASAFVSVFAAVCLLLISSSLSLSSSEEIHDGRPLSYWIDQLENVSLAEKRLAAIAIIALEPKDQRVVDLLISALRQQQSYELQTLAANALARLGPFAVRAIPALIDTLAGPDIQDDSVREQSASALSQIASDTPLPLTIALEEADNEMVIVGLLRAMGHLRASDDRSVNAVLAILQRPADELDLIYERAVWALDRMGPPALPRILAELQEADNPVLISGIVTALGSMHTGLSEESAPPEVIAALLEATQNRDEDVAWRAIRSLGQAKARTPESRQRLLALLSSAANPELVEVSADTASELFSADGEFAEAVATWLGRDDAGDVTTSLSRFNALGAAEAIKKISEGSSAGVLADAARVLADRRFASPEVVAARSIQLNHPDDEVARTTIEALAELPPYGLAAIPALLAKARDAETDHRDQALLAISTLAQYALNNAVPGDVDVAAVLPALLEANAMASEHLSPDLYEGELATIQAFIANIQRDLNLQRAIIGGIGAGAALAAALAVILSWRVRRWIRVLLGQRWMFATERCDYLARVTADNTVRRVTIDALGQGSSAVFEREFPADIWPIPEDVAGAAREVVGADALVRVEVEEKEFGQPWAVVLAGAWTDEASRNVGGQICLTEKTSFSRPVAGRQLRYRGLAHPRDDGIHGPLPMARPEVEDIAKRFHEWGAVVSVRADDASRADFLSALAEADVVHVAAHATYDRLLLSDGSVTAQDFADIDVSHWKCRLLILSACEAGGLEDNGALVWRLVLSGVNVIAARQPVHDYICRIFFGEFFASLLPTKRASGIQVATAIRSAVVASRERLSKLPGGADEETIERFRQTVGSFMLFGDPTLSLGLSRPR